MSESLKSLQTQGISAVVIDPLAAEGGLNEIIVSLGTNTGVLGGIPTFQASATVTLEVENVAQLDLATLNARGLFGAGFDNVQIALADANKDGNYDSELISLLNSGSLASDLATLRAENLTVTTIDLGGAQAGSATLSQEQAGELLGAHLHFAAADTITLDAAQSTHLSTSLKDLSKLGVDTVLATGSAGALSVELGGDAGSLGGVPTFGSALDVTLNVTDLTQLSQVSQDAQALLAAGIDHVQLNLGTEAGSYTADLANLLAGNTLQGDLALLSQAGLSLNDTIDLGGSGVSGFVSIDEIQALDLINAGLHFAANDMGVTLNAHGTHLSTSLTDLQKLGVDSVISADGTHALHVDLGTGTLSAESLPHFVLTDNVTLDLAQGQSLDQINQFASALKSAGIDHLSMDWGDMLKADELAINALTNAGLDFNLDSSSHAGTPENQTLDTMLEKALSDGISFTQGHDINTLVQTLFDSGVANAALDTADHFVTIGDDLAAALAESGMLNALPANQIQIDAGNQMHLETSLKAMADLGVDNVLAVAGAEVDAGISHLNELSDLLSHFVSDTDPAHLKTIFEHGAELNLGDLGLTTKDLQTFLGDDHIVQELSDLGVTKVVAQVAPVQPIGAATTDHIDVFEMDIVKPNHHS